MSKEDIRKVLKTEVPTKPDAFIYLMYGYSISNGLTSFANVNGSDSGLTTSEKATYWDDASTTIRRLQNATLGDNGDGRTFLFPYLKKENNTYYDPADSVNQRYGTGSIVFTKLQDLKSDNTLIFIHDYSENGTAFMQEVGVNAWNVNNADANNLVNKVKEEFTYLKKWVEKAGYNPVVKGMIMAIAVADVWNVTSDGYTKAQFKIDAAATFSAIRTHVEVADLPIYWFRPSDVSNADRPTIIDGQDELAVSDTDIHIFDITADITFSDGVHPNGDTAIDGWESLASLIYTIESS